MKIYIDGCDNLGWAIDSNNRNLRELIKKMGHSVSNSVFKSDIIHNVLSDEPFSSSYLKQFYINIMKKRKNMILSQMNFIDFSSPDFDFNKFEKLNSLAAIWVTLSKKQYDIFEKRNIKCFHLPLFVDLNFFQSKLEHKSKRQIADELKIPFHRLENKIIIGSFQRDSLGADLSKPKWQKGPDILLELLKILPREKFILLLTSPRRHYIIKECKKHNIDYYYLGTETETDDLYLNTIDFNNLPLLYSLIDLYLVTSRSEGGPLAIIESTACKSFIFSTDVGLAPEYLLPQNVFGDLEMYKKSLVDFINSFDSSEEYRKRIIAEQYNTCHKLSGEKIMIERLNILYDLVLNGKR